MPIECTSPLNPIQQNEFKATDYAITGIAFETHTALGRLFDEDVYSNELTHRLTQANFEAQQEVEIIVSHKDYKKSYFIDLLVNGSIPYELKTADTIHTKHSAQLLNYLYLTNTTHGKILNFRTRSLEARFVSTSLTTINRKQFEITKVNWIENNDHEPLLPILNELLADWGTHLQIELYQNALLASAQSKEVTKQGTPMHLYGRELGKTSLPLLTKNTMLYVSAAKTHLSDYKKHLQRTLSMTHLSSIQWISMAGNSIQLQTIT